MIGVRGTSNEASFAELLAHADDNLIVAQRLSGWISWAPELEEDIALGNIALDHLGVARALYTHAGEVEGAGRSEDDLAYFRSEREFANCLLVEQPNGDFAHTMARQLFFDAYQLELWDWLARARDGVVAGIAAKALKEARYHFRHSSTWVIRLGDGTEESHGRMQRGLDHLWRFTGELFEDLPELRPGWQARVGAVVSQATLTAPSDGFQRSGGRSGTHTEHLGHLLAEMQWLQRAMPGLRW